MTQTLLVATYLPTFNQRKHCCPVVFYLVKVAAKKKVFHIFSVPVQRNSSQSDRTGLRRCPHCNSTAVWEASLRCRDCSIRVLEVHNSLGSQWKMATWFMAVSYSNEKIAIWSEICRLSDTRAENLVEAYGRKLQTHELIATALQKFTASRWTLWV